MRQESPPTGHYKPVFSLVEKKIIAFKYMKEKKSPHKNKVKNPGCVEQGECTLMKRRVLRLKESGYTPSEISKAVRKLKAKTRKQHSRPGTANLSRAVSLRATTQTESVMMERREEDSMEFGKRPQSSVHRPRVHTAKNSRPMSPVGAY